MRIVLRVSEVGVQPGHLFTAQAVLRPFGGLVQLPHRHVGVVGQVALPQAMRANHLQGSPLAAFGERDPACAALDPARRLQARYHSQHGGWP